MLYGGQANLTAIAFVRIDVQIQHGQHRIKAEICDILGRAALNSFDDHRGNGLAELTAFTVKPCLFDPLVEHAKFGRDNVTARRVRCFGVVGWVIATSTMIGIFEIVLNSLLLLYGSHFYSVCTALCSDHAELMSSPVSTDETGDSAIFVLRETAKVTLASR